MRGGAQPSAALASPGISLWACACFGLVAALAAQACSASADAPKETARAGGVPPEGPVARLASFAFDRVGASAFAGHSYEATCRLRLEGGTGADSAAKPGPGKGDGNRGDFAPTLLGALEEHVRYRRADEGRDFHVLVEQRFDDRFVRQGSDSMEAVQLAGRLAVRRQREDFAQVANLHGEAARYREIGRGVLGSLLAGFDPAYRREGDRVLLGPGRHGAGSTAPDDRVSPSPAAPSSAARPSTALSSAEVAPLPSRPNDDRWEPHFRYYASAAVQRGFLLWPEGASMPSAGEFIVEATLNGHAFHADCAFVIEQRPGREGFPELPEVLPSLERPRLHNDIQRVLRAVRSEGD